MNLFGAPSGLTGRLKSQRKMVQVLSHWGSSIFIVPVAQKQWGIRQKFGAQKNSYRRLGTQYDRVIFNWL